jgi:hypothetical protein
MFRVFCALLNVRPRSVGKLSIPNKVLCTMQLAPVPMSPHDGTNKVWVVLVWSVVGHEITALDLVRRRSNSSSSGKS